MNSGRYMFSISAEAHALQTINHLGKYHDTYGHWVHASEPFFMGLPFVGLTVNSINSKRRSAWLDEEAEKRRKAEDNK